MRFDYPDKVKRQLREVENSPANKALEEALERARHILHEGVQHELSKFIGLGVDVALFWRPTTGPGWRIGFEISSVALPPGTTEIPPGLEVLLRRHSSDWVGGIYPISKVEGPWAPTHLITRAP